MNGPAMAENVATVVQAAVLQAPISIRQTLTVRGCPLFDESTKILAIESRRADIDSTRSIMKNEWNTPFIRSDIDPPVLSAAAWLAVSHDHFCLSNFHLILPPVRHTAWHHPHWVVVDEHINATREGWSDLTNEFT
jgi:hypothetical protein